MKTTKYIKVTLILIAVLGTSLTSCSSAKTYQEDVAGYTLKNKKELMQQKILNKKCKTVIATP